MCGSASAAMPAPLSAIDRRSSRRLTVAAGDDADHRDAAARVGELDRVVQQVREDLHEARVIGVDVDRLGRQRHVRGEPAGVEGGAVAFHRVADQLRDQRRLGLELDLARGDARDVEQIVDETDHLRDLALHHRPHPRDRAGRVVRQAQDVEAGAQRGQRIAQLVGEDGDELVLAAIDVAQLLFLDAQPFLGLAQLVDVGGGADPADAIVRRPSGGRARPGSDASGSAPSAICRRCSKAYGRLVA